MAGSPRLFLVPDLSPDDLQLALRVLVQGAHPPEGWSAASAVWRAYLEAHPAVRDNLAAWVTNELLESYVPGPVCPGAGSVVPTARLDSA